MVSHKISHLRGLRAVKEMKSCFSGGLEFFLWRQGSRGWLKRNLGRRGGLIVCRRAGGAVAVAVDGLAELAPFVQRRLRQHARCLVSGSGFWGEGGDVRWGGALDELSF